MGQGEEVLLAKVMEQPSDPLDFQKLDAGIQQEITALGLDPADQEISTDTQGQKVTRMVEHIFKHRANPDVLRSMLSHYSLNDRLYDARDNPNGILLEAGVEQLNRGAVLAFALYRLAGVQVSLLQGFLGVGQYYLHQRRYYSPCLFEHIDGVEQRRRFFPLQNSDRIPTLKKFGDYILNVTGLALSDIFEPHGIPPVSGHSKQHSLVTVLHAYALAISGKYTTFAIDRISGRVPGNFTRVFANGAKYIQFTPAALQALEQRIKKGR